jgi:hypothetical protein
MKFRDGGEVIVELKEGYEIHNVLELDSYISFKNRNQMLYQYIMDKLYYYNIKYTVELTYQIKRQEDELFPINGYKITVFGNPTHVDFIYKLVSNKDDMKFFNSNLFEESYTYQLFDDKLEILIG